MRPEDETANSEFKSILEKGGITSEQVERVRVEQLKIQDIDLSKYFMTTLSVGVKNLFNAYQGDFDTGATRDSDYIYGPNAPRTIFIGLKFGKFH